VYDQDLKAGIVIKMRVACRDDKFVMRVLQFRQLFRYAEGVMIIDQSDRAHRDRIGLRGLLSDQAFADQVSKGLGSIGIPALGQGPVKALQKIGVNRNADSAQYTHRYSIDLENAGHDAPTVARILKLCYARAVVM
jgi:hypothetical protein